MPSETIEQRLQYYYYFFFLVLSADAFVWTGYGSLRTPSQHVGGLFSLLRFPVLRDELVRRFKESNACYSMLRPLYEYAVCPRGTKVFDHPDSRSVR